MQTQDKPLYCFLYNEDDGSITRTTITKYTSQLTGYLSIQYAGSCLKLHKSSLDQLRYNKVFTFNPDPEFGKKAIYQALNQKLKEATKELKKCQARLMVFKAKQGVEINGKSE